MIESPHRPYHGLGKFEDLYSKLQKFNTPAKEYGLFIFAGDNGISCEHTTIYPPMKSVEIVWDHIEGKAPTARLLKRIGKNEIIIDIGLYNQIKHKEILERKIRKGTVNFLLDDALSCSEVLRALEIGQSIWEESYCSNFDIIGVGEIGSGNTLCAAALAAVITGYVPDALAGRGSADYKVIGKKIDIIHRSICQRCPDQNNVIDMLARFGGLEIAALTGFIMRAAEYQIPIMLDGYVTAVAALLASIIDSRVTGYLIAPGLSENTGHILILNKLNLEPVFNLDLNYGEGLIAAIGLFLSEMAVTFFN